MTRQNDRIECGALKPLREALIAWQDRSTPETERALWKVLFPFLTYRVKWLFFCWQLGRQGHKLEDCVQEVVVHFLEARVLHVWDRARGGVASYLGKIILRALADFVGRRDLLRGSVSDELAALVAEETPETLVLRASNAEAMREHLVTTLDGSERELYDLLYVRELAQADAATVMGVRLNTLAKRHERLKLRVARQLTALEGGTRPDGGAGPRFRVAAPPSARRSDPAPNSCPATVSFPRSRQPC